MRAQPLTIFPLRLDTISAGETMEPGGDMALVKCPDCAGQLSTEAIACPHCGRPNRLDAAKSARPAQPTVAGNHDDNAGRAPPVQPPPLSGTRIVNAESAPPAQPPPLPGPRAANAGSAQSYQVPKQTAPQTSAAPVWESVGSKAPAKTLSTDLVVGIVVLPFIFAWFTLRKGYSTNQRFLALGWMVLLFVLVRAGNMNRAAESPSAYPATVQPAPYVQPIPSPQPIPVAQTQDPSGKAAMVDFCGRNGQDIAERIDPATGASSYHCIPREEAPKVERPVDQWIIKDGFWVGAPTKEQFKKFMEIANQGDEQALREYVFTTPGLDILKPNTVVYIVEMGLLSSLVKVRPKGQVNELYISHDALKK